MTNAAEERDLVALETHPRSSPKAEPAASELLRNLLGVELEACRQSLDDDDERFAV
jgi:hypothetical protein